MDSSEPLMNPSLYVGDLHPDTTELMLYEKFSPVGPVVSVRVCRDIITRRSLGYAYVNFMNAEDAKVALETMNFDAIMGRPMRIMWKQRNPFLRKSQIGNIFIKNLDKGIDSSALHDTLSTFGNILSSKVVTDEEGNSKGYGFVQFETEDIANQVIKVLNGKLLNGKQVYVGKFIRREDREKMLGDKAYRFTNVYVKNFGDELDDTKLKGLFERYGTITSAKVVADEGGKSKCFGFVNFEDPESARKAVEEMNGMEYDGKQLYVGRAQKKADRQAELRCRFERLKIERWNYQGTNLYVTNLEDAIDDER